MDYRDRLPVFLWKVFLVIILIELLTLIYWIYAPMYLFELHATGQVMI
jgi:hypothetical protein